MNTLSNVIEKILLVFLSMLLLGIVVIVGLQVVCRYMLGAPLTWSEEVARYLMVWFSLLGAVLGVRHHAHVAVDFFVERLPWTLQSAFRIGSHCLCLIFLSVLTVKGFELSFDKFHIPSPASSIPMGLVYLSIPVGGALMVIFQIESMLRNRFSTNPALQDAGHVLVTVNKEK